MTNNTLLHDEIRESLGLLALDLLDPAEAKSVRAHLADCLECQEELRQVQSAALALPLSVEEMEPPADLRSAILAAVEREPQTAAVISPLPVRPIEEKPTDIRDRRWWLPWAAAAAMLVLALGLLIWNLSLRDDNGTNNQQQVALNATSPDSELNGTATYDESNGVWLVSLHDLPPIAADQVYQFWGVSGEQVSSLGVMTSSDTTFAFVAPEDAYTTLAVTVEPGPVGVPAATTEPILTGDLSSV